MLTEGYRINPTDLVLSAITSDIGTQGPPELNVFFIVILASALMT